MHKAVDGIYENGKITLKEKPDEIENKIGQYSKDGGQIYREQENGFFDLFV